MSGILGRAAVCTVAVLLVALPGTALAAPVNDMRANASQIDIGDFQQTNNVGATVNPAGEALTSSGDVDGCETDGTAGPTGSQLTKTVWWRFVGTGEPLTISTKLSDFDTVVAVYTESTDPANPGLIFEGCNDDAGDGGLGSEVVIPTDDNLEYFIQVGGCDQCPPGPGPYTPDEGNIAISLDEPPANDERGAARTIPLNTTVENFTFGALSNSSEAVTCAGVDFDKTVWYRFTTPAAGTLTLTASGFPLVSNLYNAGGSRLQCATGSGTSATLSRKVGAGTYFVQVGGKGVGTGAFDGRLNLRAGWVKDPDPPPLDSDGDGIADSADHCPGQNAAARDANRDGCLDPDPDPDGDGVPVARDKCPTQNARARDKDGDGCLDPLPRKRISADARLRAKPTAAGIRVVWLKVIAPRGSKVTVRCGSGCRFAKRATASADVLATASRTLTVKKLTGRSFRAGQKIRIYVTRKNRIGAYFQYSVKRGDFKRIKRCLNPGSTKPRKKCR